MYYIKCMYIWKCRDRNYMHYSFHKLEHQIGLGIQILIILTMNNLNEIAKKLIVLE